MKVQLMPRMSITKMASYAAKLCYTTKLPQAGVMIDVLESLFKVSHHTTLQHSGAYETFVIEGVPVSEVTFGLHLTHPFYDTDQRSGRYAGKMFQKPDYRLMLNYVRRHWPELTQGEVQMVHEYLKLGCRFYREIVPHAVVVAERRLKEERPFIKTKQLAIIAPKVAQEQARMFIPTIFPTALVFTVNFTALIAMWLEAWTPGMREMLWQMICAFVKKHPDTKEFFEVVKESGVQSFAIHPKSKEFVLMQYSPQLFGCEVMCPELFVRPEPKKMHPVDRLHFDPELMDNNIGSIQSEVAVSIATYGQDQRHRMVKRGKPSFTGGFYLPPLLQHSQGEVCGHEIMHKWIDISGSLPNTLAMLLAPYGAMVRYHKLGSFNAKLHEQGKRLCFAAQEEIYNLSCLERIAVENQLGSDSPALSMYQPPCLETGKCGEGERYCGRALSVSSKYFFLKRRV